MLVSRSQRAGTASGSRGARGSGRPGARQGAPWCCACGQPPRPQPGSRGGGAGPAALLGLGSLLPRPCEGRQASLRLLLESCRCPRAGCRQPAPCRCRAQPRHQTVLVSRCRGLLPGCGSAPPSGAGRRWLVREQLGSHTENFVGGGFCSAGSSAGLEGRQRQEGLVWVRLV